jgi:hypothetical protein
MRAPRRERPRTIVQATVLQEDDEEVQSAPGHRAEEPLPRDDLMSSSATVYFIWIIPAERYRVE